MQRTTRFTGEYPATLDGEGRIQLPLTLRDEMNVRSAEFRLMANLEPDGSLCLREQEGWEAYVDELRSGPTASLRNRRTLLFLAANSAAVRCDKQGRVRIPDPLLAHAGIDRTRSGRKELVIVGNFDDLRVWHPDRWNAWGEEALADFGAGVDALLEEGTVMREADDREP
jgi:MraZ protein